MPYGTVKLDTVIYTSGGLDANTSISGLANGILPKVSSSGTVTGSTGQFNFVSGSTVSGVSGLFTSVVSGTSGIFGGSLLTDPEIVGSIKEDIYTISDGAAFEVDPSNGSVQLITLGASRTPKATNFAAGESVTLMVNDGTNYAITWTDTTWGTSGVSWANGAAPSLAVSGYTVLQFWKVSGQVYGANVGNVL